jgi:hypothetical protein
MPSGRRGAGPDREGQRKIEPVASGKMVSGRPVTSGILTPVMRRVSLSIALLQLLSSAAASAQAKKINVIAGRDSGGSQGTNFLCLVMSLLMLLRAPWKEIVVSPFEAGGEGWSSPQLMCRVVQAGESLSRFHATGRDLAVVDDVGRASGGLVA